jgi:hypothetical protein
MTLYVVGELLSLKGHTWQIVGVADSVELADLFCTTANHFYGPITLNERLPDGTVDWPDVQYPRIELTKGEA